MPLSRVKQLEREDQRQNDSLKKTKSKKVQKKIIDCFRKLNNRSCYKFLGDEESSTHQNLLDFCNLLAKECANRYGKQKSYSKTDVGMIIYDLFPEPTDIQMETLDKLNKFIRKKKDIELEMYPIKGLFPEKTYRRFQCIMESEYGASHYD